MRFRWIVAFIFCLLCLTGCSHTEVSQLFLCQVVLEEGDGFSCAEPARTVEPGADASFYLTCDDGFTVTGAGCDSYTLSPAQGGGMMLTVQNIRYSTVVTLTVEKSGVSIFYHPMEDSLWPGTYLYSTDNHLSTEGVAIHTDRIIAALKAQLAAEETEDTP